MRIIITGATSMIGTALIEESLRHGDEVLAIVRENTMRKSRLPASSLLHVEYADINSFDKIKGDGKAYDVFYHLAWGYTEKSRRDMPFMQEANIRATLEAVQAACRLGCHKFVGAGSQAEYGYVDGKIKENCPCNPATSYGMAKLAASMLAGKMCSQMDMTFVWGRIFSVYGIHDNVGTMIDYALGRFLNGEDADFSSAQNMWNYLYESDAGAMFYRLGVLDVESGVYNVASPESRSLREYIERIVDVTGTNGRPRFAAVPHGRAANLDADITKILAATGYEFKVDFDSGIRLIVKERKRNEKLFGGECR